MHKKLAWCVLMLAAALAAAGCRGGAAGGEAPAPRTGGVESVLAEVNSFTGELLRKVEGAEDVAAGVAEAQQFLDARRDGLKAKLAEARGSRDFQQDGEARRRMLESEVENTHKVAGLKTRFMDRAMSDRAFSRQLDKLVGDYESLYGQ